MEIETQTGYLVLADISGYTSYLAGVELLHARDVLSDLLELIVEHFKPLLTIAKFEGDAVFAYVPDAKVLRDETLLEILETTYLAFRDRREGIRRLTTCQCNACRAIPDLDVKFIVHHGEYVLQDVSGGSELLGSDVTLAHRLLKNQVGESTGWKAYILFTDAGLTQMDLQLENLHEQIEVYEHLGEIKTYSMNLHARYRELVESRRLFITKEEADFVVSRKICEPPIKVWEWLNDTEKRRQWETFDDVRAGFRPGGRTSPGARNHCTHGENVVVETILDWKPFEYFTAEYPIALQSRQLIPIPEGTRLNIHTKFRSRLPSWLTSLYGKIMSRVMNFEKQFDNLEQLIEDKRL